MEEGGVKCDEVQRDEGECGLGAVQECGGEVFDY